MPQRGISSDKERALGDSSTSAIGTKRTFAFVGIKSASDPKRTFPSPQLSGYTSIIPPPARRRGGWRWR
jgi:hypothetical protein